MTVLVPSLRPRAINPATELLRWNPKARQPPPSAQGPIEACVGIDLRLVVRRPVESRPGPESRSWQQWPCDRLGRPDTPHPVIVTTAESPPAKLPPPPTLRVRVIRCAPGSCFPSSHMHPGQTRADEPGAHTPCMCRTSAVAAPPGPGRPRRAPGGLAAHGSGSEIHVWSAIAALGRSSSMS